MAHVEGAACGSQTMSMWELPNVVSWQAVEHLCESMCRQKWPGLEVLNIPSAQDMRVRMERDDLELGYNIMM